MGKHSTDETPADDEPTFRQVDDEGPLQEGETQFELHLKGLPYGMGLQMILGHGPFGLITTALDPDTGIVHVSVVCGGGVSPDTDDTQEATAQMAQWLHQAMTLVDNAIEIDAKRTDEERATDSDEWTKLLSESAAHFAAADSADEKVLDPKASAHLPDLSGAVDYSAGKAFASERVGDAPLTDRDREDLALLGYQESHLGADSPIEPAIEEIIEATIEPDEEG